jgi:hypothetical protein
MKEFDEQERRDIIQKRHEDLDDVRRRAVKAKKQRIQEQLELGRQLRVQFSNELEVIQAEIEAERQAIRDLKSQLLDRGPKAIAKVQRAKIEATRQFKKEIRAEFRAEARRRALEIEKVKQAAEQLREQLRTHTMTKGDKYREKLEITKTMFLAALSDDETAELIAKLTEEDKKRVEEEIEKHRRLKKQKMDQLVAMLDEVTRTRDEKEEEHMRKKKEKKEEEERRRLEKEAREEEQMLVLEKKLEKKRRAQVAEAKEMEEHTRQVAARNRYLALNKKAIATRVFQSQQDATLRSAKERQEGRKRTNLLKTKKIKIRESQELPNLERLLGL